MAGGIRLKFEFEDLADGDDVALDAWHAIYRRSFPHADEQEPLSAFRHILRMNADADIQKRFGPYREFVLAIREARAGKIAGGLNFGVTTSAAHREAGFAASVQVFFLFVGEEFRGHLHIGRLKREIASRASAAYPLLGGETASELAIFFEANNPRKMTPEDIRQDIDRAGMNPYRRYTAWLAVGALPVDIDYVQPALDRTKQAISFLDLFYLDSVRSLPTKVLLRHLYSVFSISVLKGEDADRTAEFRRMSDALLKSQTVKCIPPEDPRIAKIRALAVRGRGANRNPRASRPADS